MQERKSDPSALAGFAQLLSLAAHEFRTPASVVGGYLHMLARDSDSPLGERQKKMVDEALKACGRVVELVAQLSDIAKLDTGAAAVQTESFDLFVILGEVAESVHTAEEREVHLQVQGDSSGAPMKGDLIRLRAAFGALFRAIMREQPSDCTIVVDRRRSGERGQSSAVVVIAQDGDVQRVAGAAPDTFDELRGGLGLALPIARRVIERHGGQIWSPAQQTTLVDEQQPPRGRGACVITLPLQE